MFDKKNNNKATRETEIKSLLSEAQSLFKNILDKEVSILLQDNNSFLEDYREVVK